MKIEKIPLENYYIRIGDTIEYRGKKYTCQKYDPNTYVCSGCCFYSRGIVCLKPGRKVLGSCVGTSRGDKENVIFKEVTEWKYFLNTKK